MVEQLNCSTDIIVDVGSYHDKDGLKIRVMQLDIKAGTVQIVELFGSDEIIELVNILQEQVQWYEQKYNDMEQRIKIVKKEV